MVDLELVQLKLQELDRYLSQLKKHRNVTTSELKADLDKAWTVQHGLQLSIQIVLDIGNHILAAAGVAVHEYADIFLELARLQIIPEEYASSIKGMAGLRNLLVHEYAGIDMAKLADIINNNLGDFTLFASYVAEYLSEAGNS